MRKTLTSLLLSLAAAGCSDLSSDQDIDDPDGKADGATGDDVTGRPWDFVYVYPQAETADDVAHLMSLADLGLERPFFDAAFGHMTGRFPLPGADADDQPASPLDPTVIHQACLADPSSWRVTQVRFAPYETAIPGTVSAIRKWAQVTKARLDLKVQVRLSVHPFCANDFQPGVIDREDQAMHLIYVVQPEDAALAASVFANAQDFVRGQLAGTDAEREASYGALERHRDALATPEYQAFHKAVVDDWFALARTATVAADAYQALDAHAKSLRMTGLAPFNDRLNQDPDLGSLAHPGLADRDGALPPALKAMVQKYARPEAMERIAMMFTVGTQDPLDDAQETRWFFSVLRPGRYDQLALMPAEAEEVYGAFSPGSLDTFVAISHAKGVDLVRATSAGFYAESRGVTTGPKAVYPAKVNVQGRMVSVKPEVDRVDYTTPVVLDAEQGHDMPRLPTGKTLFAAMKRFADVTVGNATTTPCDRCHNAQNFIRENTKNGYRAADRSESAYQFHMVTPGQLSLRTIRELDRELAESRKELGH